MDVLRSELIPDELPDERREQWRDALRILDGVVHQDGFMKGSISAYSGMELWELVVRIRNGELIVHGPELVGSGSVMDSWFACHLEIEIKDIGLQALVEWIENWTGLDQVFVPALLVEGRTARSHRVNDSETFTFVWE